MKNLPTIIVLLSLLTSLWGCNEETLVEPQQYGYYNGQQHGSVSGQVLSKKDGTPINKAAIRLTPSGRTVQTDSTGRFRFDTIPAGKYTIQAAREGFRDELTTVEVSGNYAAITLLYLVSENPLPTEPMLVSQTTGVNAVSTTAVLKWKSTDPGKDPLTYDVVITREGSTVPIRTVTGLATDSLVLKDLDYATTYYWQVTVSDGVNFVTGKMWSFQTVPFPNVTYAFARRVSGRYQIFVSADGVNAIQLTQSGSNWRPVFSPNRQQIAFLSTVDTDLHLFVMNYDGSRLHRATTVPVAGLLPSDLSFCWSPDGTQLLYPGSNKLYAVNADGSGNGLRTVAQAPYGRTFAGCDWTGQGDRIVARTTGASIYDNRFVWMTAQGKDTITVLNKAASRVGNPIFSITGKEVIYTSDKDSFQNEEGRQLNAQVTMLTLATRVPWVVMTVGTDARTTKPVGFNDLDPRFSPNSSKIIFISTSNSGTSESTVMTADFDGTKGQNRTVLIKGAEMPCWR